MARKEVNEVAELDETFDVETMESTGTEQLTVATTSSSALALGGIEGEEDIPIKLPYISIVYGVSKTIDEFDVGDLILDKTTLLAHKNEKVQFIALHATTFWKEWFTKEEREIAQAEQRYERQFATREEVAAAGGTCPSPDGKWPNNQRPTFSYAMKLDLLVRRREGLIGSAFCLNIGEYDYAPAQWIVDKTTFKQVGPIISGAARMALKHRGLRSGLFEVTIKIAQGKHGAQPVPNVRLVGNLSDEELEQLGSYFG